ncbi:MAG: TolC family protein [Desulfobacterales bacterium]|nr:TolC family protein [Desulfobacterales bacterium]
MLIAVLFFLFIHIFMMVPVSAQNRDSYVDKPDISARPQFVQREIGPAMAAQDRASENSIRVTIQDAILMALENNRSLAVERINPLIQKTIEEQEQALFDPVLNAQATAERQRGERARSRGGRDPFESDTIAGGVAVEKFFPAGTTVQVEGGSERVETSLNEDPFLQSRLGLSVTQALLRGYGTTVNLANIKQSRLDTTASYYELRGFSEALLSQVETAYWDYALAIRQIKIVEESLQLVEQQKKEAEEMIQVGKLAESELVAAQAEIAVRRQELIEARSTMEVRQLRFLRLLNPPGANPFKREVVLLSRPDLQQVTLDDTDAHVAVALKMRSDLNQARLGVQRDEIEIVKTKNGTLPKMDFFINLGKTGYADSFGGSVSDTSGDSYDALAGVRFEYPFKNRAATARYRRSQLNRDQAQRALENLSQLVELDVRAAYIEVERARQQISASSETRKLEEEKMRVETEKFRVGRSTNFLVAQVQRDLLLSQLIEVRSVASYLKALTELFRFEGSLLERRGISAPGDFPPTGG